MNRVKIQDYNSKSLTYSVLMMITKLKLQGYQVTDIQREYNQGHVVTLTYIPQDDLVPAG